MPGEIVEAIRRYAPTFTLPAHRGWSSGSASDPIVGNSGDWQSIPTVATGSTLASAYTMTVSNAAPASVMNAADILGG